MTRMTLADAADHLLRTEHRFAVHEECIRGVSYRTFRNAPASLREMMWISAQAHGDRDVLIYEDERLTYSAFCERANRLAHALAGLGVRKGDRVAVAMRNYPEILLLMMAIPSIGAIFVPVNAWWTAEELRYGFEDSGAKIAFADGPRYDRIATFADNLGVRLIGVRDAEDRVPETFSALLATTDDTRWPEVAIAPDDDFAVMYSSGSTGHPKGVVQTHRSAISAVYSWVFAGEVARLAADPDSPVPGADVIDGISKALVVTPLFHVTASHAIWLQCLALGTSVVLMHKWDAEAAIDIINREQVTRLFGVPTQCADLTLAQQRRGTAMPSLAILGAGGAKRPPVQVAQQADAFPNAAIATGWGMTETNALGLTMSGPDYVSRPGAAGRCIPPLQDMCIADEEGREVAVGEIGELLVKSPANMRCYLNRPDDTAEVLKDGWLHTGDLARVDDEGYYYVVDRKKSIIIRGGENISVLEVEAAIHRHPDVHEAGVFSVPDMRLGETVGAGVQLKRGTEMTTEDLRSFLAEHIAQFKVPSHIWFRADPLPRGATDKIDRRALRGECIAHLPSETAAG
ncbi:MAG: class I adenylate-forming enzyme family protein [Pseudomonadota bacterium]